MLKWFSFLHMWLLYSTPLLSFPFRLSSASLIFLKPNLSGVFFSLLLLSHMQTVNKSAVFSLHLWSLFSLHNYFRCLDLLWLQQQTCLPYYFPFPVKLSSFLFYISPFSQMKAPCFCFQNFCTIQHQLHLSVSSHFLLHTSADFFFSLGLKFFK